MGGVNCKCGKKLLHVHIATHSESRKPFLAYTKIFPVEVGCRGLLQGACCYIYLISLLKKMRMRGHSLLVEYNRKKPNNKLAWDQKRQLGCKRTIRGYGGGDTRYHSEPSGDVKGNEKSKGG